MSRTQVVEGLQQPAIEATDANRQGGRDLRRAARRPTRTSGILDMGRSKPPLTCGLIDVSATGARLKLYVPEPKPFVKAVDIPARFTLLMRFDRVEAECQLVWRRGNEIGVRFLSPLRPLKSR
jgi:hypothetical protein